MGLGIKKRVMIEKDKIVMIEKENKNLVEN